MSSSRINKSTTRFVPKRRDSSATAFQRASSATPSIQGTPRVQAASNLDSIDEFELDLQQQQQQQQQQHQRAADNATGVHEEEFAVPSLKRNVGASTAGASASKGGFAPKDPELKRTSKPSSTNDPASSSISTTKPPSSSIVASSAPPSTSNSFKPRDPTAVHSLSTSSTIESSFPGDITPATQSTQPTQPYTITKSHTIELPRAPTSTSTRSTKSILPTHPPPPSKQITSRTPIVTSSIQRIEPNASPSKLPPTSVSTTTKVGKGSSSTAERLFLPEPEPESELEQEEQGAVEEEPELPPLSDPSSSDEQTEPSTRTSRSTLKRIPRKAQKPGSTPIGVSGKVLKGRAKGKGKKVEKTRAVGERRSSRFERKRPLVESSSDEEEEEEEEEVVTRPVKKRGRPAKNVAAPVNKVKKASAAKGKGKGKGKGTGKGKAVEEHEEEGEFEAPIKAPKRKVVMRDNGSKDKGEGISALLAAAAAAASSDQDDAPVPREEAEQEEENSDDSSSGSSIDSDDEAQSQLLPNGQRSRKRSKKGLDANRDLNNKKKKLKDLDPTMTTMSEIATGRDTWDGRVSKRGEILQIRQLEVNKKRRELRAQKRRHYLRRKAGFDSETDEEGEEQAAVLVAFAREARRRGEIVNDPEAGVTSEEDQEEEGAEEVVRPHGPVEEIVRNLEDEEDEALPDPNEAFDPVLAEERNKKRRAVEIESPEPEDRIMAAAGGEDDAAVANGDAEDEEDDSFVETTNVPQVRFVDGQLQIDEASLEIDRAQQARDRDQNVPREVIQEGPQDKYSNSAKFLKNARITTKWHQADTDKFYDALRQFGTDFEMIAGLFPHRNRRQIKSKWVKEDRENPHKITNALMNKKEIDLDSYSKLTGHDLSGPVPDDPMERINKYRDETAKLEREQSLMPGSMYNRQVNSAHASGSASGIAGGGRRVELLDEVEEQRAEEEEDEDDDEAEEEEARRQREIDEEIRRAEEAGE